MDILSNHYHVNDHFKCYVSYEYDFGHGIVNLFGVFNFITYPI
ncbi:hypothetical protein NT05LI_0451 [Listeria ivanovii FSL F6-596]|nr:hypothetical protein NT05LI_0451 [Listeria ivanovii FSL F6-596]